jgi:hypothetical protein
MAGSLLDELVDAFDEDEVLGVPAEGAEEQQQAPLVDAEDFMRRAVQMIDPARGVADGGSEPADPEEKADYYRRMVEMQDMMRANGYEGTGIVDALFAGDVAEKSAAIGLQVCSEFQKSGGCRAGVNCQYVHDGAFRVAPNGYAVAGNPSAPGDDNPEITVDPEDFIRRALQLRSLQQKHSKQAPGRASLGQEYHRIPYW